MASRTKTCDFCGKREIKTEMIIHNGKYLCDEYCVKLYSEAYEQEVKKK